VATVTTADSGRSNQAQEPEGSIRSLIPARLDRLGWSRFHTHLEIALGVAWVLVDAEQKSLEDIAQPLSATRPSSHLSAVTGAPRSPAARSTLV
jgi:hypothetical protein